MVALGQLAGEGEGCAPVGGGARCVGGGWGVVFGVGGWLKDPPPRSRGWADGIGSSGSVCVGGARKGDNI